ncbi:MAG: hypothetical protein JSR99_13610 [Proteobacteria bacterium]|nr:hypothetical protein [Pseudomonadota bacterium]
MTNLTQQDIDLLRGLLMEGGSCILRDLPYKAAYSALAGRGYVLETQLARGDVHVVLTDAGRRALHNIIN